tara:strand:- start:266 stop:685 length:420 start_codon:yes stop_codon:yes gene_type:complete
LNSEISDKDKKDWENFLSKEDRLPNKDLKQTKKISPSSTICDLHGYSLDKANERIRELINHAYNTGIKKILIITGKGLHSDNEKNPYISKDLGILKNSVPNYIKSNLELMKLVQEIREADANDGGGGAFYIFLKKKIIK